MDFYSADQAYTLSAFYYARFRLDSNSTVDSSECENFWDVGTARICPQYFHWIALIPLVSVLIVILYDSLELLIAYRPKWTQPFVQEFHHSHDDSRPHGRTRGILDVLLLLLSSCGVILQAFALWRSDLDHTKLFMLLTWISLLTLVVLVQPRLASTSILVLFMMHLTAYVVIWSGSSFSMDSASRLMGIHILLSILIIIVILNMPLRSPALENFDIAPVGAKPTFELRSPEDDLTLWQYLTVSWMAPLLSLGKKQQLNDEDVWFLPYAFQHTRLHEKFRELQGSVIARLLRANGIDLVILTMLGVINVAEQLLVPVLLQQLLRAIQDEGIPRSSAITYTVLSMLARLIDGQLGVLNLWYGRRCYERSRGEMITMLFAKTLRRKMIGIQQSEVAVETADTEDSALSEQEEQNDEQLEAKAGFLQTMRSFLYWRKPALSSEPEIKTSASMGKILNLMRSDVYEVSQRFWDFQTLITIPMGLIFSFTLLWQLIGWPVLFGVAVILLGQVLNALFAGQLVKWETIRRLATDAKLQKVSQFVEALRHLRWYGWQDSWCATIMEARQKELNLRIITGLWGIGIHFTNELAENLFPAAAFYAYTALAGKQLTIDVAFPVLQIFSIMEDSIREIPNLITVLLNARVAMGRIQDFMDEPDMAGTGFDGLVEKKSTPGNKDASEIASSSKPVVSILSLEHASFTWPGASALVLEDVTVSFDVGLTIVCGIVGSGKTALLQGLLGELDMKDGDLERPNEVIGYCSQTPWLQSMSIRDNILFSAPYDERRYRQVLEACALVPDLADFKHGDHSQIGENGIGLSGGQRARVALARAVYSRARILLLDDPISALDHQTAEFVMRNCLAGELVRGRTIVLVTHRTQLCKSFASKVYEVSRGHVKLLNSEDNVFIDDLNKVDIEKNKRDHTDIDNEQEEQISNAEKFIEDEFRAHGGVKSKVYWEYIKAGKLRWWAALIVFLALFRLNGVVQIWFLKAWGEAYNQTIEVLWKFESPLENFPPPEKNVTPWLIGFAVINAFGVILMSLTQCLMLAIVYITGKQMFRDVMARISHTTFRYYDVTPVGRLLNRLSSDISTIDGNISQQFNSVAGYVITWLTSIIVIASITPLFLLFTILLVTVFIIIFLRFLPTSQSLRRLEMTSLSPLMSNFGALVQGLTTVRAFQAQHRFQKTVIAVTDNFQKMDHFYWSLQSWLSFRLSVVSAISILVVTLIAIFTDASSGLTAFVLIAATRLVTATHGLCRSYGQLQMDFVSVERVVELLHLQQEEPGTIQPPAAWPRGNGDIEFDNVTLQYAPHLEPSLHNISLRIPAGKTTAIVGRTGSGKSTLAMALLATITPTTGTITIDAQNLATVSKQALRERITFVAQDPVLFPGTMRRNLDPMDEFTDVACEDVLSKIAGDFQWTLEMEIEGGGRNFSQGQRQLIGLARTILRRSAIVILDEATASIDTQTAEMIQDVLTREMAGSTIITIAHRIEAVRSAEWCIVLEKGRVARQGTRAQVLDSTI